MATVQAKPQIKIYHNKDHDMLCAEVLVPGRWAVCQVRAVAKVAPLRQALRRRAEMSGYYLTTDNEKQYDKAAMRLAGRNLQKAIVTAARAPAAQFQGQNLAAKKRVVILVDYANSGRLDDEFGGWDTLFDVLVRKHYTAMNAAIAKGTPPEQAEMEFKRKVLFDKATIKMARAILDEDDEENNEENDGADDEDGVEGADSFRAPIPEGQKTRGSGDQSSGFSFRTALRRAFMPHTFITDRKKRHRAPASEEQETEDSQAPEGEPVDAAQSSKGG